MEGRLIKLPRGIGYGEHPEPLVQQAYGMGLQPENFIIRCILDEVMDLRIVKYDFVIMGAQFNLDRDELFHVYPLRNYKFAIRAVKAADRLNSTPSIVFPSVMDSWPPRRRAEGVIARYYAYAINGKPIVGHAIKPGKQARLF